MSLAGGYDPILPTPLSARVGCECLVTFSHTPTTHDLTTSSNILTMPLKHAMQVNYASTYGL